MWGEQRGVLLTADSGGWAGGLGSCSRLCSRRVVSSWRHQIPSFERLDPALAHSDPVFDGGRAANYEARRDGDAGAMRNSKPPITLRARCEARPPGPHVQGMKAAAPSKKNARTPDKRWAAMMTRARPYWALGDIRAARFGA